MVSAGPGVEVTVLVAKSWSFELQQPIQIQGRCNWLLMEKDPNYEHENIGDNCETDVEHIHEMAGMDMPRDFLTGLTKYFIPNEG